MPITLIGYFALYITLISACLVNSASWGVYLYQIHYFANPAYRWWGSHLPDLRYSLIASLAILFAYLLNRDLYAENRLGYFSQLKWFLLLIIMSGIGSFYAACPEMHNENFLSQIKLFVFVALTYKVIDSPQKYEKMMWAHILGVFYIGWVAHGVGRTSLGRLDGVGPVDGTDANDTAAVLLTALPLIIYFLIYSNMWIRVLLLAGLAYILDGIILCNSRGAFVGIVVSIGYYVSRILVSKNRPYSHKLFCMVMLVVSIGLFFYLSDPIFWERMATLQEANPTGGGGSGADRVYFWKKSLELTRLHPFGVGYWGFQFYSPEIIPPEMLTEGMRAIHSTYFQALSEYGYIGPFVLAGYLFSSFLLYKKTQNKLIQRGDLQTSDLFSAVFAGFIGFLGAAAFLDRLHAEMMYWFPLYLACGYNIFVIRCKIKVDA